jgi:hypothetical protein
VDLALEFGLKKTFSNFFICVDEIIKIKKYLFSKIPNQIMVKQALIFLLNIYF